MESVLAIAMKTILSAVRAKVVHVLLVFCFLAVVVLPLTLVHDGTARGLMQVSLTYTLGIVGILLALVAVWLGSTLMAQDIEGYQIHMVLSKPVSRLQIWIGKWLGIVALLGGLLLLNACVIYGICMFRLHRHDFEKAEMQRLENELFTARKVHKPKSPDLDRFAKAELSRRLAMGAKLNPQITESMVLDSIKNQLKKGEGDIPFRWTRPWVFKRLPAAEKEGIYLLRYKVFVEKAKNKDQRETVGIWYLRNPDSKSQRDRIVPTPPLRIMGGSPQVLPIPKRFTNKSGEIEIWYENLDPMRKTVVIQKADGPFLMGEGVSFLNNYSRVVFMIFLQIVLMATLGCASGGALSTPVAIFISFSYVSFGLLVRYVRIMNEGMEKAPKNHFMIMIDAIGRGVKAATVSLNEFLQIGSLTEGRLIELKVLAMTVLMVLIVRGLPIALVGIFGFYKRELGLIPRK